MAIGKRHAGLHARIRNAFVLASEDVGSRVLSGAGFTFLVTALRTLLTIGSTAILARLLTPADFGYLAMATVVTEFAALFSQFGFSNILVQRRVITRLQLDTVFWASFGLGAVLALIVFLLSFFADWLFKEPISGELLRVLCLTFLVNNLTTVPWALLLRRMQFRTEFWIQLGTISLRSVVAIVFAWLGFGVWSLVIGSLSGVLMNVLLAFIAVPYMPRLRFHMRYLTSTWRTSGAYFGGGLLFYAHMNVDLLMIGRQLGAVPLGYYQNARSLTDEVRSRIAIPLQHVLFPAFSSIQSEPERLRQLVMRGGSLIAAVIIPVGFGAAAVSEEIVPVLYGDQWLAMIPVLSMLGYSTGLKGAVAIGTPLFNSQDKVALNLRYSIISTILMVVGVVVTLPYGINAVAASIAVTSTYALLPFGVGLSLIGLRWRDEFRMLGPPALAASLMWLAIWLVRPWTVSLGIDLFARLMLHIVFGALVYAILLHAISRSYLYEFLALVRRFR